MSNIKMSKDVKKSKRCQEVQKMSKVRWPGWWGKVAWGGRGEVAGVGGLRWPGVGGVRWLGWEG